MPLSLTPETKNTLTLTSETKTEGSRTWDGEGTETLDDSAPKTWDNPGALALIAETKTTISLTNETKL